MIQPNLTRELGKAHVGSPTLHVDIPEWVAGGACASVDPDLFFPEKGGTTRDAKRVCMSCGVRVDCLEAALARQEAFGVWGGMSERERRRVRGARAAAAASEVAA